MIRGVDDRLVSRNVLEARCDNRCAGSAENVARPICVAPVVNAAGSVLDTKQAGDDRGRCMQNCGEEKNQVIPQSLDIHANLSNLAGRPTGLLLSMRCLISLGSPASLKQLTTRV